MTTALVLDPALSSRLCLTLMHSLWQVALLAGIVWCGERLVRSVERRYLVSVAAMFTGLLLLPVTFALVDVGAFGTGGIARQGSVGEPQRLPIAPVEVAVPAAVDVEVTSTASGPAKPQAMDVGGLAAQQLNLAAVESASTSAPWSMFASWLAACYVAGVGLMLLRLCFGVWSAQRLVARSRPVSDPSLLKRLEQLVHRLSLRARPAIAYSEQVVVPKIVGLLRPVILLPTSAMAGLAPEQVEMVLAHELIHLRRHDLWINLLQRLAEAVLFFNPALWYLSHRINVMREYACDDAVCRLRPEKGSDPLAPGASNDEKCGMTGSDPFSGHPEDVRFRYATALLQIAEHSRAATARPGSTRRADELTTLASAGRSPSELRRRIARLVGEPLREPLHLSRGGLLTLLAVAVIVTLSSSLWPVSAQTNETDGKAEQQRNSTSEDDRSRPASEGRIEVVAIGTHNENPQRWWDATGAIAQPPSIEWQSPLRRDGDDRRWRRVVIHVRDLGENEEVRWELPGINETHGMHVSTGGGPEQSLVEFAKQFVAPEEKSTFQMRVGIASGEWKTVSNLSTGDTLVNGRGEPSFISSGVYEQDGGTGLLVAHDVFKHNFRIIAIDKNGQTHDSGDRGGSSMGKVYQTRARFPDLPLEQVDHFEFQTRPYEWIQIDDLPLEPSSRKDVTATNADGAAAAESNDAAVDLPIVVAGHVLLLDGREVITWDELEAKIAALPDPSLAYPRFYVTRGAREAGLETVTTEQMSRLSRKYSFKGLSIGSLWPRTDLRYDRVTGAEDLVPDESLRIDGRVVDADGNAVAGAEVIVITPIDESILYRSYHMALVNGRVRNRLEHVMSVTDTDGRFAVYPPAETPFTLVTLHPDGGFALTGEDQLARGEGLVKLLRWASIAAKFTEDKQSQQVDVNTRVEETDGRPEIVFNQYWSDVTGLDTENAGVFRYTHVPPIYQASVSRSFPTGQGGSVSVHDLFVSLLPGENRQLPLGPMSDQQRQQIESIRGRRN